MYKSFEIKNFRGFTDFKITSLDRINLVCGRNNVGKTSLLEALFLHGGFYKPEISLRLDDIRGILSPSVDLSIKAETPWDSLFHGFDVLKKIEIAGSYEKNKIRSVKIKMLQEQHELSRIRHQFVASASPLQKHGLSSILTKVVEAEYQEVSKRARKYYMFFDSEGLKVWPIPAGPQFQTLFMPSRAIPNFQEDSERFDKLVTEGRTNEVVEALRIIEPYLKELTTISKAGGSILHASLNGNRPIPLPLMGEGLVRLTTFVVNIANAPNGVLLIDEIENGLHHSIMQKVWKVISKAARQYNTQVFATTHSFECIQAAHNALSEGKTYDFRLHRLDRKENTAKVTTYDKKTISAAIETELEVR